MTKIASPPIVLKSVPGPEICELCGNQPLMTELVRDPFIYGAGSEAVELSADVPVHTCSYCSISYTGEEAEIAWHEAVCRHLGVLTPREIRAIRRSRNMSRTAFASLTGCDEADLTRWERGEIIQTLAIDGCLRRFERTHRL